MGFGIPDAERKAIEMTYEDSCEIIRCVEIEDEYITKTEWRIVYKDVKCALSTGNAPTNQTETVNNILYDGKIFLPPEPEVKPGDRINVNRLGEKEILFESAGEPAVYETHQEVMVKRRDRA